MAHNLLHHAFEECLSINPAEHPLMITEPSYNTKLYREQLTQEIFETYGVPGLFVAKNAVLSCFAVGKASAAVLDSGAFGTSVIPVHDGYVLNKGLQTSNLGGSFLSDQVPHPVS